MKSTRAKIQRAAREFDSLYKDIALWTSSNPIIIEPHTPPDRLSHSLIFKGFKSEPDSEDWGLRVGDIVHNLRSALDNLFYDLAVRHKTPPDRPRDLQFPIHTDAAKFNSKLVNQISPAAAEIVERIQPFQRLETEGPDAVREDPLHVLHQVSNADKHRIPQVVVCALVEQNFKLSYEHGEEVPDDSPPHTVMWAGQLEKGCALVYCKFRAPIGKIKGHFDGAAKVQIIANSVYRPLAALHAMVLYTALVADCFLEFFPEHGVLATQTS